MSRDEVIERFEHARLFLQAAVSGIKNERLEGDKVGGQWTVRDIVAHLAGWEKEFHRAAKVMARRSHAAFPWQIPHEDDWREFNAKQVALRQDRSVGEIFLELEQEQHAFTEWARRLTERQLAHEANFPWGGHGTLRDLLLMDAEHKIEHAHRIRAWRHAGGF
ncbi:MAG: ClbS/DfsB family four-helix bundle protein [Armatimonadetes bacterium]|nr:ClbS/DfsB family four-helix bundle protein [Armatimonadota bacterium]